MWRSFEDEYLPAKENQWGRFKLTGLSQSSQMDEDVKLSVELIDGGKSHNLSGAGNGPIAAFVAIVLMRMHLAWSFEFLIITSTHYQLAEMQRLRHTLSVKYRARFIGELELIQALQPLR
jgi:hypothetical protein